MSVLEHLSYLVLHGAPNGERGGILANLHILVCCEAQLEPDKVCLPREAWDGVLPGLSTAADFITLLEIREDLDIPLRLPVLQGHMVSHLLRCRQIEKRQQLAG